ncbi:tRNA pseudouridine(38-40) synthase TruA [Wukongibacter baidiensis]|uniref:tRNA pseudouridine(38-40) synthase TruA n=1 Tax=Wukongibacter baidiensis TaxID=1723361 RepID=UPI003D7FAE25
MKNIKLIVQYDGSRYKGWQRLGDSDMTVQGKLEDVLSKMTGEKVEIFGSGRTDAGVHALMQMANFKTNSELSSKEILDYCYRYLPDDIVVKKVRKADDRFHSRYSVKRKRYLYKILNYQLHDPFTRKYITHIPENLNIKAMEKAANYLVGEHDFSSFTTAKSKKKSRVRTIYDIDINKEDKIVEIMINGSGFLHNMVRIIVGTLIEVGLGRLKPEKVLHILNKKDRKLAGPTAPAKGLFLYDVEY